MPPTPGETEETYREFRELVNMTPATLERWLETEESRAVGWKGEDGHGSGESVGHKSGKRIVEILHRKKADLDEDDYAHMVRVIGYIRRHSAQRPEKDAEELAHMNWTYSLKNWGNDPLAKGE